MKFTDGQWLLRPGVTAHSPPKQFGHRRGRKTCRSRPCASNQGQRRHPSGPAPDSDAQLAAPQHRPRPDRAFHRWTRAGPASPLEPKADLAVDISEGAESATLTTGELIAQVKKPNWGITFEAGGRVLTTSGWRGIAYMQTADRGNRIIEQLSLGVGECVYGLGERFTAFVKNGQVVEITNKDGGTASEQAYKSVPFYLTNRGYGVLVNETGPVSFEVASQKVTRVQFSLEGESLEYFLIYGPTPKDILRKLTALTGRPALPPAWSFGLWLSTSFTDEL